MRGEERDCKRGNRGKRGRVGQPARNCGMQKEWEGPRERRLGKEERGSEGSVLKWQGERRGGGGRVGPLRRRI